MTPQLFGSFVAYALVTVVGLATALFGWLRIGRTPSGPHPLDVWLVDHRALFRLGGSAVAGCGTVLLALLVARVERKPPTPVAPAVQMSEVWVRHATRDGAFSAEVPWPVRAQNNGIRSEHSEASFMLDCETPPPHLKDAGADELLAWMRGQLELCFGEDVPHELIVERDFVLEGSKGREWVFRQHEPHRKATLRHKVLVRDGKLYRAIGLTVERYDEAGRRFLDSVRVELQKP